MLFAGTTQKKPVLTEYMPGTGTHNCPAKNAPGRTAAEGTLEYSGNAGYMLDTLSIRIGVSVSVLPVQIIISVV